MPRGRGSARRGRTKRGGPGRRLGRVPPALRGAIGRVVLQRPAGVNDVGNGDGGTIPNHRRTGLRAPVAHPIVRLTEQGIDWGVCPEPGDEIGYAMHPHRGDDCLSAAIATCTQIPIEQVPDLKLNHRSRVGESADEISRTSWERIERWAKRQALALVVSHEVPMPLDRWIGVTEGTTPLGGHSLVMSHDRLFFNPSCSVHLPGRATGRWRYDPSEITYGIAFHRKGDSNQ